MTWQTFGTSVMIFILGTVGQNIVFPDDSTGGSLGGSYMPIIERVPIHREGPCPLNMEWYSEDGNTSIRECDCSRGFLYSPLDDSCHKAYKQGPCPSEHYLVLPPGEELSKCEKHSCTAEEGLVSYKQRCYKLNTRGGPCAPTEVLNVNETTFQLECILLEIRPTSLINVPANRCPNGSRRTALGRCRVTI